MLFIVWLVSKCQGDDIYVASTGTNNTGCGSEGTPCKTVGYAVKKGDVVKLIAGTIAGDSSTVEIGTGTKSIEGSNPAASSEAPIEQISQATLQYESFGSDRFTVSTGSLSLKFFYVVFNTQPTGYYDLVYVSDKGGVVLDNMEISSGSTNYQFYPILYCVKSGSVSISHSLFKDFYCPSYPCIQIALKQCSSSYESDCINYPQYYS